MPHIHTQPDQHDITVSAWIVLRENEEWKCLVHYHKKMDVLMQVGGHLELTETPWQAMTHELMEESGYDLSELAVLQFTKDHITGTDNIPHPTPFAMNTHLVGDEHFHSDISYGFVATDKPSSNTADGESDDIRWMTQAELDDGVANGTVLQDVAETYRFLLAHFDKYQQVPADTYPLEKPSVAGTTYKRGRPRGDD